MPTITKVNTHVDWDEQRIEKYQRLDIRYSRQFTAFKYNGQQRPNGGAIRPSEAHRAQFRCACPCGQPLGLREDVVGVDGGTMIVGHSMEKG